MTLTPHPKCIHFYKMNIEIIRFDLSLWNDGDCSLYKLHGARGVPVVCPQCASAAKKDFSCPGFGVSWGVPCCSVMTERSLSVVKGSEGCWCFSGFHDEGRWKSRFDLDGPGPFCLRFCVGFMPLPPLFLPAPLPSIAPLFPSIAPSL